VGQEAGIILSPAGSAYEKLIVCYSFEVVVKEVSDEIVHDFGNGFDAVLETGFSEPLRYYTLNYRTLPQCVQAELLIDIGDGLTMTPAHYYTDFLRRHRQRKPFLIDDLLSGQETLVKLAGNEWEYRLTAPWLWSSVATFREWRGSGETIDTQELAASAANPAQI
jgi:hypothetical protein